MSNCDEEHCMMPFGKKSTGSTKLTALLALTGVLAGAGCDPSAGQTADIEAAAGAAPAAEASASVQALMAERQAAIAQRGQDNLQKGADFLETNGTRDGVVTLPSGLQYEVLNAAEGARPAATATVTTHYHGTLIDGTVFDSSYERGEPASFPLNGVIPGWTQALQLMAVGAKWRLFIPPTLAYGAADKGSIPANSTLIFDVELLEIQAAH